MAEPDNRDQHLLTRALFALNRLYSRNYHHVDVLSPCPLPRKGPAIVICNHISSADPFLVQGSSHRVIRWMMAKEYFDLPVVKTLCSHLGFIPVIRSGRDSSSLKAALRTLAAGNVLGIFPEGRIAPAEELLPFQTGIGMIAQRSGAPVFPVAIEKIPRNLSMIGALSVPYGARIIFGSPVDPCDEHLSTTALFRQSVQALQQQALAANTL